LRHRVEQRSRRGRDVSEADVGILERQLSMAEPLSPEESALAWEIGPSRPLDSTAVGERLGGT